MSVTIAAAAMLSAGSCDARLCFAENLAPFFAQLNAQGRDERAPIHIMQIGDSHTAGDMITNGYREPFRRRYGHGGRGVLAAGRPYSGYLTWGVTASQTDGWSVNSIFGRGYANYGQPLGISGFSQTSREANESIGISADDPSQRFDSITVCAIARPGAGSITMRLGFATQQFELEAPRQETRCASMNSNYPQISAALTTNDDRIVTITSFATMMQRGGVTVSNVGVSGSQMVHLARANNEVVRTELEAYSPDLIAIAFGTNEGFSQQLSPSVFESDLRAQVNRIRRLAGRDVPILLIGAPDANTRSRGLADNAGSPSPCPDPAGVNSGGRPWYTPTLLAEIRNRQRRVAADMGLAFWDWEQAMGGRCSAHRWRNQSPRLVRGDHVHFTQSGGTRVGGILFADLERAAAAFNGR